MSNLREHRRLQTAAAIRTAAVELSYRHGLDQITTEMISEAAGISPRTFFNYFPFKEAALVPQPIEITEGDKDRFVHGKGPVLADMRNFLDPILSGFDGEREFMCKSYALSLSAPKLLALQNSLFMEFEALLAEILGRRHGLPPDNVTIRHMALVIAATVKAAVGEWVERDGVDLHRSLEERLNALPGLFAV